MIKSFKNKLAQEVFDNGDLARGMDSRLASKAHFWLDALAAVSHPDQLPRLPGAVVSQLEEGLWEINRPEGWRIVFRWSNGAEEVSLERLI